MPTVSSASSVKKYLARLTDTQPDDWFLVLRARLGMELVFHELANVRGHGEVVTQPFTCTTALNPILSAGHIPVYVDTSPDTLSLDTDKLQASASSRAVVVQHTFGIEAAIKKARTFASKHSLLLMEDSAHSLGLLARSGDNPLADVSVQSFGVEKMLPTKFGGAVWINPAMKDRELHDALVQAFANLPPMSRAARRRARSYTFFNGVLNHTPPRFRPLLRHMLVNTGLFEPAISAEELQGKNRGAIAVPDARIVQHIAENLSRYEAVVAQRRAASAIYRDNLPKQFTVPRAARADATLIRFPVLCETARQAEELFHTLRAQGYYSGKWYNPTLFPGTPNPELYNYDAELYPVAEQLSAHILNLPTNITTDHAKEIVDVLRRHTNQ